MSGTHTETVASKVRGTPTIAPPADAILVRGRAVLDAEAGAITDARDRLENAFVGAVQAILACKGRVCVTGMGKAGLIGSKIAATFASTGTVS